MTAISQARIAILATNGFEQSELEFPLSTLRQAGAAVEVISPEEGEITGWEKKDWGSAIRVDRRLDEADPARYDALVLPGGQINPDLLRLDDHAIAFVKAVYAAGRPVAAICHAPWLLVEAGLLKGRRATSWASIRTDLENAGARWEDSETVRDGNLITARKPDDLPAFVDAIVAAVEEGRQEARLPAA